MLAEKGESPIKKGPQILNYSKIEMEKLGRHDFHFY